MPQQRFKVRLTVELTLWPGLADRDPATIAAVAVEKLRKAVAGSTADVLGASARVVDELHLPVGSCRVCNASPNGAKPHDFAPAEKGGAA